MRRRAFLAMLVAGTAIVAFPSISWAQPSGTIKIITPQPGGGFTVTDASPLSGQRGMVLARGREIISAQNQLPVRQQNGLMHRFVRSLLKPQSPAAFVRNLVAGGLLLGVTWAVSNHVAITPREGGGFNRSSPASSHPTSSYQLAQSSILNQGSGIFRSSNGQLVAWRVEQGVGAGSRSYAGWSRAHVVNVRTNEIGQTIQKVWFTRVIRAANVTSHSEVDLGDTQATEAEEAFAELAEQQMSEEVAQRVEEALINAPAESVAENEYVQEAPAAPQVSRPANLGPAATGTLGGLVSPAPGESEAWEPVVNGTSQAIVNPNVGTSGGDGSNPPPTGGGSIDWGPVPDPPALDVGVWDDWLPNPFSVPNLSGTCTNLTIPGGSVFNVTIPATEVDFCSYLLEPTIRTIVSTSTLLGYTVYAGTILLDV